MRFILIFSLLLAPRVTGGYTPPSPTPVSFPNKINFSPSKFNPLPLFNNQHIQTVGGALLRKTKFVGAQTRATVRTVDDNDFFDVDITTSPTSRSSSKRICVMLHGLESTSSSPLCQAMSAEFVTLANVDEVHTICFRGCSGRPNETPGAYHLGFTSDIKHYLEILAKENPDGRVYLSGFSLGANVVLKCLGELGPSASTTRYNVQGAAVTCVPFDCERCQPRLDCDGFNKNVYSRNFLKTLIAKTEDQFAAGLMDSVDGFDIERVRSCTTIGEFDDAVVAPVYGFSDKIDYYRQTSCINLLPSIAVPFYVVNALDDPFFDPDCFPSPTSISSGLMTANYVKKGGHCGFIYHDNGEGEVVDDWMPKELARFVKCVDDSIV